LFANVLKKFFTPGASCENKGATKTLPEVPTMLEDLKSALSRTPATLGGDMAGGAALVILFLAVLHLPGFV
jgi:hypothetical protein